MTSVSCCDSRSRMKPRTAEEIRAGSERTRSTPSRTPRSSDSNPPGSHSGRLPVSSSIRSRNSPSSRPRTPQPCVHHDPDLLGPQSPLRQRQRSADVLGHQPAGVADHVRLAELEIRRDERVDPAVHAGDDRQPAAGKARVVLIHGLRSAPYRGGGRHRYRNLATAVEIALSCGTTVLAPLQISE